MKKILALGMSAAMALSVAAVSFAATPATVKNADFFTVGNAAKIYNEETKAMEAAPANNEVEFDSSVYFEIGAGNFANSGTVNGAFSDKDIAKNIKLKDEWEVGKEYVDSVKLSKVYADGSAKYFVEVALKASPEETEAQDIIGTVKVSSSKMDEDGIKEKSIDVALTASNKTGGTDKVTDKDVVFTFGDGEEEFELELYADMGRFVVDTRGQGDLVIRTDVDYNRGIENVASDVNYVYFNGNGATFNKIGTLYLNADEDNFLYRVNSDGRLTKVDASYDEDEEAFKVRTRVLGSYVISESELDLTAVNAGLTSETEAPTAPAVPTAPSNPATGAAL